MKTFTKIITWVATVLAICGMLWFLLPFLHGGFGVGAAFGFFVCLFGFCLLRYGKRFAGRGKRQKLLTRMVVFCYALGLCWAGYLTGCMLSAGLQTPPPGKNVIVLGAQVYSAERMGVTLTNRINAAYSYLSENPEVSCIVTGGQGKDEPCPEALTEQNALLRLGVAEERIYLEDRSKNTRQNLNFAMEIAERENLGKEAVIVTQGFHMFRAKKLAQSAGFTPYALAAETDPLLLPEYAGRELLSLTKWHVETLILHK